MIRINWDDFKEFKQHRLKKGDNFDALLEFLKSFYNISYPTEMYKIMMSDDLAVMMLKKRDINSSVALEEYLQAF